MARQILLLFASLALIGSDAFAQDNGQLPPIMPLGGPRFDGWTEAEATPAGATLKVPSEATWRHPDGPLGDYPLGNEAQRRKTYAIRAPGKAAEARFLTLIEPYEDKPVVKSAMAESAGKLRVELTDGRVQEISIERLDGSGKDISVSLAEPKDGSVSRTETAGGGAREAEGK